MKYQEFVARLENHPELELVFNFQHELIRNDYHITEVLNSHISAIDCGKGVSRWNETIVQLYEPTNETAGRYMSAQKALGIFKKSQEVIAIPADADIVLEFRPKNSAAAQRYMIENVTLKDGKLYVDAAGATTQCKPSQKTGTGCR